MELTPQDKHATVIYHFPCMDGFTSAWAFNKLKAREYAEVNYVPTNYGTPAPYCRGDVYILDFSFPRDQLFLLSQQQDVDSITIFDHHLTAKQDLENWTDKPDNVRIVFDMEQSGCGLTWNMFAPQDANRPMLVDYVEDRDLWRFKCLHCKEINAVVANTEYTFEAYESLANDIQYSTFHVKGVGAQLLKFHQRICEDLVRDARKVSIQNESGEWEHGLGCGASYHFASEVGNILAKLSGTYGLTYYYDKSGAIKHSLRSIGDYDVSRIAKRFGGGGHKNASGFTITPNETDRSDVIKIWKLGD